MNNIASLDKAIVSFSTAEVSGNVFHLIGGFPLIESGPQKAFLLKLYFWCLFDFKLSKVKVYVYVILRTPMGA